MTSDLGKQALRQILRRVLEPHRAKAQPAADRLLHDANAIDRATAVFGPFGPREGLAHMLDQGVVTAFDASQPLRNRGVVWASLHGFPEMAVRFQPSSNWLRPVVHATHILPHDSPSRVGTFRVL